jgi:hypothetical protein
MLHASAEHAPASCRTARYSCGQLQTYTWQLTCWIEYSRPLPRPAAWLPDIHEGSGTASVPPRTVMARRSRALYDSWAFNSAVQTAQQAFNQHGSGWWQLETWSLLCIMPCAGHAAAEHQVQYTSRNLTRSLLSAGAQGAKQLLLVSLLLLCARLRYTVVAVW